MFIQGATFIPDSRVLLLECFSLKYASKLSCAYPIFIFKYQMNFVVNWHSLLDQKVAASSPVLTCNICYAEKRTNGSIVLLLRLVHFSA